ncbi:MAG: lysophospholipid acyltransferase family protein [Ignavibacteriaceae bacterium]|nr:lysophospholipid acyltransferase family protein [Ignavibacteriaceae bacterium]NUM70016.1 lysophospholipid acyltransferase family protein [Ignavibacteriaceae bacterium]
MQNLAEYILFQLFSLFFRLYPGNPVKTFAPAMAYLFSDILKIRKRVVIKNLKMAFPELSETEIMALVRKTYLSNAKTIIEILTLPSLSESRIKKRIKFSNTELLKKKYEENKGVMIITAHFGNWEYAALSSGIYTGITHHVMVQSLRNTILDNWLNRQRTMFNNKVVYTGISVREVFGILKSGGIVAIAGDQRGPEEGIRVNLMGIPSTIHEGIAAIALKTGAGIIMGMTVRQPDGSYICELQDVPTDNLPEGKTAQITEISQRHTNVLEQYLKKYPDQYFWMHNRWKY